MWIRAGCSGATNRRRVNAKQICSSPKLSLRRRRRRLLLRVRKSKDSASRRHRFNLRRPKCIVLAPVALVYVLTRMMNQRKNICQAFTTWSQWVRFFIATLPSSDRMRTDSVVSLHPMAWSLSKTADCSASKSVDHRHSNSG